MATRSLGSLTLDLIARVGGFEKGMDKAARSAQDRSRRIQRSMQNLRRTVVGAFAGLAAYFSFREIQRFTRETIAATSELGKAAATADVTAESVQELRFAFDQLAGVTERNLDLSLQRLNRRLGLAAAGGGPAIKAFQELGIEIRDASGAVRETEDVLEDSLVALANMSSEAERAARASELFGEDAGPRLAAALSNGIEGLNEARQKARDLGLVLSNDLVKAAEEAQDRLDQIGQTLGTDFRRIVLENLDTIESLAEGLLSIGRAGAFAAEKLVQTGQGLGIFVARALGFEDAEDRLAVFESSLKRIRADIQLIEAQLISSSTQYQDDLNQQLADLNRELEIQLAGRQQLIKELTETPVIPTIQSGGDNKPPAPIGPSEQFLELQTQLRQQIELFGQVGVEAKLAYDIASGALDELTASEQAQLLTLARQIDSMNEAVAATQEMQAAADQLRQAYESQVDTYERQLELTSEATELERIRFELARGNLVGLTELEQEHLEQLAQQIDLQRELAEAADDAAREHEEFLRRVQEAGAEARKNLETIRDELVRNTQNIIADGLVNGFEDGARGMLDAFRRMLLEMIAQAAAAKIAEKIFGGIGGAGGGGGEGGGFANFLSGFFGGGRATGGPVSAGKLYRINEQEPEYFVPSTAGQVVPLSKMGGGTVINFAIQAPNGSVSRETQAQIGYRIERALTRAGRRNG